MSAVITRSESTTLKQTRSREWISVLGLAALAMVLAMVLHRYRGLDHDSQLYSFQAMARLKPALLGNDLYLRFGSQDNYTIFSPIFAALIGAVGLEPAAALITLFSQTAFLVAAWFLARDLMPRGWFAWLGVVVLLGLPGVFGALGVWNIFEGFATPRLFCEALTLAAIVAALRHRFAIATGVLSLASAIHPLMAMGGILIVLYMRFAPLPRQLVLGTLFLSTCAAGLIAMFLPPDSSLILPPETTDFISERQGFLFLTLWESIDWARAGVYVTALVVGAIVLPRDALARNVCIAAVAITLAGLAISLIGGDLLHLKLIIRGQAWRWMWIATVLAALLSPLIATAAWNRGPLGQLAAGLMLVAWLAIDEPYTIIVAPLAIASATAAVRGVQLSKRAKKLLRGGMVALLAIVFIRSIGNALLTHDGFPDQTDAPLVVRTIRDFSIDGLLPTIFAVATWWLLTRARWSGARTAAAAACAALCIALVPVAAHEWDARQYPQSDFDAFATWRALIPPGQEVFWIEGSIPTWAMLERPRYITNNQTASVLFSEGASRELRRRALQIAPFAAHQPYLFWKEDQDLVQQNLPFTLDTLCAAIDAPFVVSAADLSATPLADAPPGVSIGYRAMKLYKCEK